MSTYSELPQNDRVRHVELPTQVRRLLDLGVVIGHMATSLNGMPHVTPVWLDYDNAMEQLLIDVEVNTVKLRNVRQNPNVCISLVAPHNSKMWAVIKGVVTQIDHVGEDDSHVQAQAQRYLGRPKRDPGERCILRIKVTGLSWWGGPAGG